MAEPTQEKPSGAQASADEQDQNGARRLTSEAAAAAGLLTAKSKQFTAQAGAAGNRVVDEARDLGERAGAFAAPIASTRVGSWLTAHRGEIGYGIVALALVGLAALVRLGDLGGAALSPGEEYAVETARLGVVDLVRESTRSEVQPPLYVLLLKGWMEAFSDATETVRLLSALLGIATVGAMYALGRTLAGHRAGVLAAFLTAVSAFHATFSQEARVYPLLACCAALSFAFFVKTFRDGSEAAAVGYVAATVALVYTHIFGLFVVLAQIIIVALAERPQRDYYDERPRAPGFSVLIGIVAILYLPWAVVQALPSDAVTGRGASELEEIRELAGSDVILDDLTEPTLGLVGTTLSRFAGSNDFLIAMIVIAGVALGFWIGRKIMDTRRVRRIAREGAAGLQSLPFLVPLVWAACTLLVPYAISRLVLPMYEIKYTVATSLGLYLLVAVALAKLKNPIARGITTAAVVVWAVIILLQWSGADDRDYWRGVQSSDTSQVSAVRDESR